MTRTVTLPCTYLLSGVKSYNAIYAQLEATGTPVNSCKKIHTNTVQLLPFLNLLPPPHCRCRLSEVCLTKNWHRAPQLNQHPKTYTIILPERNPPLSLSITTWHRFCLSWQQLTGVVSSPQTTPVKTCIWNDNDFQAHARTIYIFISYAGTKPLESWRLVALCA